MKWIHSLDADVRLDNVGAGAGALLWLKSMDIGPFSSVAKYIIYFLINLKKGGLFFNLTRILFGNSGKCYGRSWYNCRWWLNAVVVCIVRQNLGSWGLILARRWTNQWLSSVVCRRNLRGSSGSSGRIIIVVIIVERRCDGQKRWWTVAIDFCSHGGWFYGLEKIFLNITQIKKVFKYLGGVLRHFILFRIGVVDRRRSATVIMFIDGISCRWSGCGRTAI